MNKIIEDFYRSTLIKITIRPEKIPKIPKNPKKSARIKFIIEHAEIIFDTLCYTRTPCNSLTYKTKSQKTWFLTCGD